MKKALLHIVLLLLASPILAQSSFFNKKFAKNDNFYVTSINKTQDNGFFISGTVGSFPFDYVGKLDQNANFVWAKKVATKDFNADLNDAKVLSDGNFIVSYTERTPSGFSGRLRIVKMDNTMSNVIWSLESSNLSLNLQNIQELKNGNIAVTGLVRINVYENYNTVFILDKNGNLLWQKTSSYPKNKEVYFTEIQELNDGQLLMCAFIYDNINGTNYTSKILKISADNGSILWQNEYKTNGVNYEYPAFVSEDKDGNLYFNLTSILINSNDLPTTSGFCKIDKNGEPIWMKNYGNEAIGGSIISKPDGTFVANFSATKIFNYHFDINIDGNASNAFREIAGSLDIQSCFDQDENLILVKSGSKCSNLPYKCFIERRPTNGQGICDFATNIVTKDKKVSKLTLCPFSSVANVSLGFVKVVTTPLLDLLLSTENQIVKCPDTVFVRRCEGDIYTVGNNQYTEDGIYLDVIQNQNCFTAIVSKLNFLKKNNTLIDTTFCEGKSIKIGSKEFSKIGDYKEVLKNSFGCDSVVNIQIKLKTIQVNVIDSLTMTEGEEVNLNATSTEKNVSYEWSPPENLTCAQCPKTVAKPSESIDYTVKGISQDGCKAKVKVNVKVFKRGKVFIPNAFSPDDNGTNDGLMVFGNQGVTKILDYSIFDRWGNQIFNQKNFPPNDPNFGWNGKVRDEKAQQGIYIYKIQIKMENGQIKDFSGDVLLN